MIENYTGVPSDVFIICLGIGFIALLVLLVVMIIKFSSLNKSYRKFMEGNEGKNLEETLIRRLDQIDELIASNNKNERNIEVINKKMLMSLDKYGLVRYDALDEMGGKLSYTLAILDEKDNGFILNNMHGRDGNYCYVKEVINGNTVANLSDEEKEALDRAINYTDR